MNELDGSTFCVTKTALDLAVREQTRVFRLQPLPPQGRRRP
jgi:hypothetical protein